MSNLSLQFLSGFIVMSGVNVAGLLTDSILIRAGLPMISDLAVKYPIMGITLVSIQFILPVTLAGHFYYYPRQVNQTNSYL